MSRLEKYLDKLTVSDEDKIEKRTRCGCALVIKEGENGENLLLILRRSPSDHWPLHYDLPRGGCDYGKKDGPNDEKILPCVKRECKEETGLDVIPIKFIDKFQYIADNGTRATTQYNFLCKMKDPNQKVKLSNEHDNFEWISSIGQAELFLLPEIKRTIVKVLNPEDRIVDYPESELTDDKISEMVDKYFR